MGKGLRSWLMKSVDGRTILLKKWSVNIELSSNDLAEEFRSVTFSLKQMVECSLQDNINKA